MSLYTSYELAWCPRCKGERPHSKRGRCLATHRTTPLRRTPFIRTVKAGNEQRRWEQAKAACFERDGWRCQRCGTHRDLDPHHRVIRGHGGTSDDDHEYGLAGLVSLCRYACHTFVHQNREDAERLGFIIPRFGGADPASVPVLTVHGWRLYDRDGGYSDYNGSTPCHD